MNMLELGVAAARQPKAATEHNYSGNPEHHIFECAQCAFDYALGMKPGYVTKVLDNTKFCTDRKKQGQCCYTCGEQMVIYEPA